MIIFRERFGYWRWKRWTAHYTKIDKRVQLSREAFSSLRDCIRDAERWQRCASIHA